MAVVPGGRVASVDNRPLPGPTDGSSALEHSWNCWQGRCEQSVTSRHSAQPEPVNRTSTASVAPASTIRALVIANLLVAATVSGGCVFFTTQAHDFAQERWDLCRTKFPGAELQQIDRDGLIRFYDPEPTAAQGMQDCLNEIATRQSTRVLAPKPPPAVVAPFTARY